MKVYIRPVSFTCNRCCENCYEMEMKSKRKLDDGCLMSEAVFNEFKKYDFETTYCFVGGEPLLAPLSFYQSFFDKVHGGFYEIETNGLLIDAAWINLFKEHNITIRLKIDFNKPNFSKVMDCLHLLKSHGVMVVVVSQIDKDSSASKLMNFYLSENIDFVSFDLVNKVGYGLTPYKYYHFFKELFEVYRIALVQGKVVHIDYFDELFSNLVGYPVSCHKYGKCSEVDVYNSDGQVYHCRYDVKDIKDKEMLMGKECLDCPYIKACFGECLALRKYTYDDGFCGKKAFLDLYINEIKELV